MFDRVFVTLYQHAGEYVSDNLKMSITSYGEMHGGQITWEWLNHLVDSGIVGQDGGRIYLALLTNSQPWWGFGFLRTFQLKSFSIGETIRMEFYHYVRGDMKLNGLDELKARIAQDKEDILRYFGA